MCKHHVCMYVLINHSLSVKLTHSMHCSIPCSPPYFNYNHYFHTNSLILQAINYNTCMQKVSAFELTQKHECMVADGYKGLVCNTRGWLVWNFVTAFLHIFASHLFRNIKLSRCIVDRCFYICSSQSNFARWWYKSNV